MKFNSVTRIKSSWYALWAEVDVLRVTMLLCIGISASLAFANPIGLKSELITGRLRITGSETMDALLARWSEAFARQQPALRIEIEGKGSQVAIHALVHGSTSVAALSRSLTPSEKHRYRGTIFDVAVAVDTLRFWVRDQSPLLETPQVAIAAYDSSNSVVRPAGRNLSSGTRQQIQKFLDHPIKSHVYSLTSPAQVALAVERDPRVIGYAGSDAPLSRVQPIGNFRKPRTLHLAILFRNKDAAAHSFLKFVLSPKGQDIVKRSGFTPLDTLHRRLALQRLETLE